MNDSTSARPLTGGVSCDVWIERDAGGREIVVKQPLARLRVVADWRANPERYLVEVRALATVRDLLGESIAPRVLWVDAAQQRFAMERVDTRLRNWKSDLLAGRVDLITAARAGELLGLLHTRSAMRPDIARDFANRAYFEELRIEPFFHRVAQCNPNLAAHIEWAIDALRAPGIALVHGDYSPKNLLVDGADVVILDMEVAHFGNPRFDIAFCLTHLLLKSLRRGADAVPYVNAIRAFVAAYEVHGMAQVLDAMLVRIVGCLLLARLEGDSPVDYRADLDAALVKSKATMWIENPTGGVSAIVGRFFG